MKNDALVPNCVCTLGTDIDDRSRTQLGNDALVPNCVCTHGTDIDDRSRIQLGKDEVGKSVSVM